MSRLAVSPEGSPPSGFTRYQVLTRHEPKAMMWQPSKHSGSKKKTKE